MVALLVKAKKKHCTPIQRTAWLASVYSNEIYNGGHWQYFCNQAVLDHNEVVQALRDIGADEQAEIFTQAMVKLPRDLLRPKSAEDFVAGYDEVNMGDLDNAFYNPSKPIEKCLEEYLDKHEAEFIEWVP
jgi:hypothetical protein